MCILGSLQLYLFRISVNSNICIEDIYIDRTSIQMYVYVYIYRVSQEECARLREGVPYVKVYRYNLKQICPKLNVYGDNGQRNVCFLAGPRTVPVS